MMLSRAERKRQPKSYRVKDRPWIAEEYRTFGVGFNPNLFKWRAMDEVNRQRPTPFSITIGYRHMGDAYTALHQWMTTGSRVFHFQTQWRVRNTQTGQIVMYMGHMG